MTKLPAKDLYVGTYQVVESDDGSLCHKGTKITATPAQINALSSSFTDAVLTNPQINDTSSDHQYVVAVSELAADRTVTLPLLTGNDEFVFKDHTQTLTNKTLTAPKIATTGAIVDAGGDEYVVFTEAATPVTYVGITSGNTGVAPQVRGAGETNTSLLLAGTGTGNVQIADGATTTKMLDFELVGATAATKTTIVASQTTDRTITLPDADGTVETSDSTSTLTNKTLTTPVIASFYQDAGKTKLMTTPNTASDTICAIAATQTLTNKHLTSAHLTTPLIEDGDTGVTITSANQTNAAPTVTIPDIADAADTFVMADTTQTLTGKTLTSPTLTTPKIVTTGHIDDAGGAPYLTFVESATPLNSIQITQGDTAVLPRVSAIGETNIGLELMGKGTGKVTIVDATTPTKAVNFDVSGVTATKTATLTFGNSLDAVITFPTATATLATIAGTENLTGKTLTSPKIDDGDADVTLTSADQTNASATVTIPDIGDAADVFTMVDTAQTLTNKTLTTPVVASFYQDAGKTKLMTTPNTASDTLCAIAATQTLTNKTLTSPILTTPLINDGHENLTITSANQTDSGATATVPDLVDSADTFVMADVVQTITNKVMTDMVQTWTLGAHDYGGAAVDWTLSAAELLKPCHKPTNANGACNAIIATATIRPYTFINATGQALTVKTAAGSGVAITNGKVAIVMSDGTNVIALATESA